MSHDVSAKPHDAASTGRKGSSIMRALTILEEVALLGQPVTPTELSTTMIIGAMARIGIV